MKILVTGGLGVNGSWVTRKLIERGYRPLVVDHREDFSLLPDAVGKFDLVIADITDLEAMTQLLTEHDINRIVHMAAYFSANMDNEPYDNFKVTAGGTVTMLEAARRSGVDRVIYTSSRAVYGETPGDVGGAGYRPLNEDTPLRPVKVYDVCKLASEGMGRIYRDVYGLEFAALRFSGIYGPGKLARHAHTSLRSLLVEHPYDGRPVRIPKGGEQLDDMIYVDDAAEGIVLAVLAETLPHDAYNIASGEGHTLREFADAVRAEIPGADIEIGPGLSFYSGTHSYAIFDISRAREDFGFVPRFSIADGVRDYVATIRRRRGNSFGIEQGG